MAVPRLYQILQLPLNYFAGGARLTESLNDSDAPGLMEIVHSVAGRAVLTSVTATTVLTEVDEGGVLEVDPAGGTVQIQIPGGDVLPVGFYVVIRQVGTGTVQIVAGSGSPTIQVRASASSPIVVSEQFASAMIEKRAANTFLVSGELG